MTVLSPMIRARLGFRKPARPPRPNIGSGETVSDVASLSPGWRPSHISPYPGTLLSSESPFRGLPHCNPPYIGIRAKSSLVRQFFSSCSAGCTRRPARARPAHRAQEERSPQSCGTTKRPGAARTGRAARRAPGAPGPEKPTAQQAVKFTRDVTGVSAQDYERPASRSSFPCSVPIKPLRGKARLLNPGGGDDLCTSMQVHPEQKRVKCEGW